MLLLAKIDLVIEKQGCKKDVFRICKTNYIKTIFILLTDIVALYIENVIV